LHPIINRNIESINILELKIYRPAKAGAALAVEDADVGFVVATVPVKHCE
jgi:hypothetical protein